MDCIAASAWIVVFPKIFLEAVHHKHKSCVYGPCSIITSLEGTIWTHLILKENPAPKKELGCASSMFKMSFESLSPLIFPLLLAAHSYLLALPDVPELLPEMTCYAARSCASMEKPGQSNKLVPKGKRVLTPDPLQHGVSLRRCLCPQYFTDVLSLPQMCLQTK